MRSLSQRFSSSTSPIFLHVGSSFSSSTSLIFLRVFACGAPAGSSTLERAGRCLQVALSLWSSAHPRHPRWVARRCCLGFAFGG